MRRSLIITLGALLILIVVGALAYRTLNAGPAQSALAEDELTTIQRGSLIATVSATGAIKPRTSADLAFLTSGNVSQL